MRHISLCLFVPFVLACGIVEPSGRTIRVEGTVTAADDGTPVVGAALTVWNNCFGDCSDFARDTTDASGHYSLSFVKDNCLSGLDIAGNIIVTHPRLAPENIGLSDDSYVTCVKALQIIDIQLERNPTF